MEDPVVAATCQNGSFNKAPVFHIHDMPRLNTMVLLPSFRGDARPFPTYASTGADTPIKKKATQRPPLLS